MKNVLKKPLTITLATLLLASQPGMASIAAFAAEAPAGGTQAIQGRSLAPVYVKTAAELKAAMINSSVKDIIFTADINWSGTINQKGSKSIYGNNHKINFNGGNIYGDWDSVNELYDMTVENGGAWGGFFGGTDNTINSFHNVSFTGANTQAAFNVPNGTLNLSGNIYVSSSAKDAIQAARVNIDQSAIVTIYSSASALNITPDTVGKLPSHLMINDKATVTLQGGIASNAINNTSKAMVFNWGSLYANGGSAAYASNGGKVFLDETSTSEFTSKSGVAFTGGLEIADNANLSIKTGGGVAADFSQSIGFTAAPKANFVIEATNKAIIGDSGTPVSLQPTQGISVWNISSDPKGAPTNAYAFSKAEFKIDNSGLVAGMVTDSPTFASTFNNAYIKKIAYGSYSVNVAEHNRQAAAENAVKDLFNNSDVTGTIKDTTNQEAIDNAQKAIDAVTDATKKSRITKRPR
ncbi:pectate lyase-like adhesive domain-containing protein [Listeria riparia]|uniref:Uncharacterized protein n=1 Tax=Listeria riparia FSL S10-1204 TaxID=1265816 RepID=W7CVA1_9LIST|nr:pectate lyase-like adhesive domain-containing protein [Listeria riparia]EUJ43589.1 hypothetical protein PRIP_12454 [Listeria riparia FSL S10-1204]